ncbi:hypothetical protein [Methylotuvimicrobium buryatense]|uniref:Uncharacterized protein n=1 Tax=Methylotuvimicrobium buryatense TaxID=95641 RepID=A0A4P9UNI7_METBY|nr:hypothetical protein [Methylotuvimicrobium buryatense]QCW82904.1 hypothetical protein EQU24_12120 [Methylotuvimicrobium buryatense]
MTNFQKLESIADLSLYTSTDDISAAIPNLEIKKGVGYAWRGCRQQGAAAKLPWMGLRRSSTGIPHTLKSAKLLKLGIADISANFYGALAALLVISAWIADFQVSWM